MKICFIRAPWEDIVDIVVWKLSKTGFSPECSTDFSSSSSTNVKIPFCLAGWVLVI